MARVGKGDDMISIPLFWWHIPLILFLIPVVYGYLASNFYIDNDPILATVIICVCWGVALGICGTKFFIWVSIYG